MQKLYKKKPHPRPLSNSLTPGPSPKERGVKCGKG